MKNKTVWANRLKGKTSLSFQKIGSSIGVDKRLYEQDIAASIAVSYTHLTLPTTCTV